MDAARRLKLFAAAAFALASAFAPALAQAQIATGVEKFYDAPTRVNMGGRPVTADIALWKDQTPQPGPTQRLFLVTDVTDFVADVEKDVEKWVATHQDRCGQRWGAGKPVIDFPPGAIRFAVDLELEVWNCGWDGKGEPGLVTREAGSVSVTLDPYVEAGKLQARLADLSIDDRSGVSKFLPLEFILTSVLNEEIKHLNAHPKFYKAPKPFIEEGFNWDSISARRNARERVLITARFAGKATPATFTRVADRVRAEGISAEGVKW